MRKNYWVLIQIILAFSCFSAELEKAIYDYNNNKDGFKNEEIANLEKKIVKRTSQGEYLLFYDISFRIHKKVIITRRVVIHCSL